MKKRHGLWKHLLPVLAICCLSSYFAGAQVLAMTLAKEVTAELDLTAQVASAADVSDPFFANDSQKVWTDKATVDIFSLSYDETGAVTVRSADDDKVIAPGTNGSFYFRINNTTTKNMDCIVSVKAWYSDETYTIPVLAKFCGMDKTYFVGSESAYDDVMALDGVTDRLTLGAKRYFSYEMLWEWPFEGDDAFDTMLGNASVDKDISLTIEITTYATYDDTPDTSMVDDDTSKISDVSGTGDDVSDITPTKPSTNPTHGDDPQGSPIMGDNIKLGLWMTVFVVSLMLVIFMLILPRRRDDDEDETEPA